MSSPLDFEHLLSHKIERNELEAGDHIYSWRTLHLYSHHGIYVGDGKVIHFSGGVSAGIGGIVKSSSASPPCPKCGDKIRSSGVISSCLDCFLIGGKLCRYQYGVSAAELAIKVRGGCTTAPSDPAELVIDRANFLLKNNGFGKYSLRKNNCEDFSLYCKTESVVEPESSESTGRSSQTKTVRALFHGLKKADVGMAINFCKSRYKNDIGVRADVRRISVEELSAHATSPDSKASDSEE